MKKNLRYIFFIKFTLLILLTYSYKAGAQISRLNLADVSQDLQTLVKPLQTFAQPKNNISEATGNPLAELKRTKTEDLSKRTATAKHFKNADGSYTAIIGAGQMHYQKNGKWEDISTNIEKTNNPIYKYTNSSNIFESSFGLNSKDGVVSKTKEGEIKEFLNTKMYWESENKIIETKNSVNVKGIIDGNKLFYPNLFGEISAEYTVKIGQRKLNYIIPNKLALGSIPSEADYLVFQEEIIIPKGWNLYFDKKGGINIEDQNNQLIYNYIKPEVFENYQGEDILPDLTTSPFFEIEKNGNRFTIKTKVKVDWLISNERIFPLAIDPTVNVYPNNANRWSVSVYSNGTEATSNLFFGQQSGMFLNGYVRFNTSSIPNGSIITSATGWINITAGTGTNPQTRQWQFANSANPLTNSGVTLYNSANLGYSTIVPVTGTGWRNSTLYNPQGNTYIENNLVNNAVNLTVFASGTYSNNTYMTVANHTSANRPYLVINYLHALNISNAHNGASHTDGKYGFETNTSVTVTSGTRPGYNVTGWIGTGSVPTTGSGGTTTFNITQNSTIDWQWEKIISPENILFHNYGGNQQLAFNNSRHNNTIPTFRLSHTTDPATDYEIEINTNPTFAGGTSWVQSFTGNYPINTETNFNFINSFSPSSGTTYYVRARAKGEANVWSSWTTDTYSFTYDTNYIAANWFQTTQAQFQTNTLAGTVADSNHDVVTGASENRITNASFEPNLNGWTVSKPSWFTVASDSYGNTLGSRALNIYNTNPGSNGNFNGDNAGVYQTINITGVTTISADFGYESTTSSNLNVNIEIYISETNQTLLRTGTKILDWRPSQNVSMGNSRSIDVSSFGFTGNKLIKVVAYLAIPSTDYAERYFYIDNIQASTSPKGTVTSTPITLSSVQSATNYDKIRWNQTLGGGTLKLKLQQTALGGTTWTDVAGYDNISTTGDGVQEFDLSAMTAYPQIRLVGELDGAGVKLRDWAILFPEPCDKTWTGATSTDWTNPTNWTPNGIPTNKHCINIPNVGNKPNVPSNIVALGKSLELQNNALLNISPDATIRITGNITNHGNDANFVLENNASLVQEDNIVNNFNFNYKRTTSAAWAKDYIYLASPINNAKISEISNEPGKNFSSYYAWSTIGTSSPAGLWANVPTNSTMTPGLGYIARIPTSWTANTIYRMNFKGIPNNGNISIRFQGGTATDNPATTDIDESLLDKWNLIGNPYPSAIDAYKFLYNTHNRSLIVDPANPTATSNGDGALYFWNHKDGTGAVVNPFYNEGVNYTSDPNNHYIVKNFTGTVPITPTETTIDGTSTGTWNGMIPAGQSFYLRARANISSSIAFDNSMRVNGQNDNYYKNNTSNNRFWLDLTRKDNNKSAQALIGYLDNATNQLDFLFDGLSMDNELDIYSIIENHLLMIQGRALPFDTKDNVPLGYKAPASGSYRIGLFKTEGLFAPYGEQRVYLRDKTNNTVHDIVETPYEFFTAEGRHNNRFEIIYEKAVLATNENNNHNINLIYDWKNYNWLITSNQSKLSSIEIYDLSGKLIWTQKDLNVNNFRLPFNTINQKTAIIKIQTKDGNIVTKKIINP